MKPLRIIARYMDGRLVKGTTNNFAPDKADFHLMPLDADPGARATHVRLADLKAVFVVRSFDGDRDHEDIKTFPPGDARSGQKLLVEFTDGETIVGTSMNYSTMTPGFFIHPVDGDSNNLRVFIPRTAIAKVEMIRPRAIA